MLDILEVFKVASTRVEAKMVVFIVDKVREMGLTPVIDVFGNISITKGEAKAYPTFTAHMDTVHSYHNGFNAMIKTIDGEPTIGAQDDSGKQVGVGGDDKCGIYVCLRLLEKVENIKIVFFSQEEVGGVGSKAFDDSFFNNSKFVGSVDRKGAKDFATSHSGSKRVSKTFLTDVDPVVKKHGREHVTGGFTDAFNITTTVSCFNMSCGYYTPHTSTETVIISEVEETLKFCLDIIKTCKKTYYFVKPKPYSYKSSTPSYNSYKSSYNSHNNYKSHTKTKTVTPASTTSAIKEKSLADILSRGMSFLLVKSPYNCLLFCQKYS